MVSGTNGHQKRYFRAENMQNDTVKVDFRCTATHFNDFSPKFSIPPRDLTNRSCPTPPQSQPPGDYYETQSSKLDDTAKPPSDVRR